MLIKKYIRTMTTKKNLSADSQQRASESLLKDIRRNTKRIFTSHTEAKFFLYLCELKNVAIYETIFVRGFIGVGLRAAVNATGIGGNGCHRGKCSRW